MELWITIFCFLQFQLSVIALVAPPMATPAKDFHATTGPLSLSNRIHELNTTLAVDFRLNPATNLTVT